MFLNNLQVTIEETGDAIRAWLSDVGLWLLGGFIWCALCSYTGFGLVYSVSAGFKQAVISTYGYIGWILIIGVSSLVVGFIFGISWRWYFNEGSLYLGFLPRKMQAWLFIYEHGIMNTLLSFSNIIQAIFWVTFFADVMVSQPKYSGEMYILTDWINKAYINPRGSLLYLLLYSLVPAIIFGIRMHNKIWKQRMRVGR